MTAFERAWALVKAEPPIRHPTDPQQGWLCPKCGGDAETIMKNAPAKSGYNEYMLFGFECVGKKDYALADDYQDRYDSSVWHTIPAPSLIKPCGWRFLLDEPLELPKWVTAIVHRAEGKENEDLRDYE